MSCDSTSETEPKPLRIPVDIRLYPGSGSVISEHTVTMDQHGNVRLYEIFKHQPKSLFWKENGVLKRVPKVLGWMKLCFMKLIWPETLDSQGKPDTFQVISTIILYLYTDSLFQKWQRIIRIAVCLLAVFGCTSFTCDIRAETPQTERGFLLRLQLVGLELASCLIMDIAVYSPWEKYLGPSVVFSGEWYHAFSSVFNLGHLAQPFIETETPHACSSAIQRLPSGLSTNACPISALQTKPEDLKFVTAIAYIQPYPRRQILQARKIIIDEGADVHLYGIFKREPKSLFWKEGLHIKRVPKTVSWDKLREMGIVVRMPDERGQGTHWQASASMALTLYLYPNSFIGGWKRIMRIIVCGLGAMCCWFYLTYILDKSEVAEQATIIAVQQMGLYLVARIFLSMAHSVGTRWEDSLGPPLDFGSDWGDLSSLFTRYSVYVMDAY